MVRTGCHAYAGAVMADIVGGEMSDKSQLSDIDLRDLRTRIAAATGAHQQGRWCDWFTCLCDGHFSRFTLKSYNDHLADAVIRELKADYVLVPKSHTLARNTIKLVNCAYCDYEGTPEELTIEHLNECP